MKQVYTDFLIELLRKNATGMPIYTSVMAECVAKEYDTTKDKAAAAVAVAVKRIIENNRMEELRCYQKGIYFRTIQTPFGEVGINKERLIADKYLVPDMGYESGLTVLHQMGLTTQMPRERVLVTNRAGECARRDRKLGVTVKPPKTKITAENKEYLRILDVLELLKIAPIDTVQPYKVIADFIRENNLTYNTLLAMADRYYNRDTIIELAHTAGMGEIA